MERLQAEFETGALRCAVAGHQAAGCRAADRPPPAESPRRSSTWSSTRSCTDLLCNDFIFVRPARCAGSSRRSAVLPELLPVPNELRTVLHCGPTRSRPAPALRRLDQLTSGSVFSGARPASPRIRLEAIIRCRSCRRCSSAGSARVPDRQDHQRRSEQPVAVPIVHEVEDRALPGCDPARRAGDRGPVRLQPCLHHRWTWRRCRRPTSVPRPHAGKPRAKLFRPRFGLQKAPARPCSTTTSCITCRTSTRRFHCSAEFVGVR